MNVRNGTGGSSSHASTRPFAVALSVGLEFHNRDETGGERVSNYCVETKLEADAELIRTALFLAFNLLYQPAATRAAVGGGQEIDARLPNRAQRRGRRRSLVSAPLPKAWRSTR
jgi:hypothetical protein